MRFSSPMLGGLLALAALTLAQPTTLAAQGVTTGAIGGTVTNDQGHPIADAIVSISNPATGARGGATTRANGQYFVQGLEVGGPYTVVVRRIGLGQQTRSDVIVSLSQTTRSDFTMKTTPVQLGGVVIEATRTEVFAPSNTGTKSVVSDTAIQRLPTTSRNLTDFIKLTPQVSQSGPGFSGGGMSNRMNNVQIDGASERDVFGLGTTGTPGAEVNAKGISIDAVKEYQVILAPFDVRQGNFGGLLLNAVTKSGTNQMSGSAFYYFRNERFGADTNVLRATKFDRTQWGFTVGGPIIRDKLHYFIAPEFTTQNQPVTGPYYGQPLGQVSKFAFEPFGANPTTAAYDSTGLRFDTAMARIAGTSYVGGPGYRNIPNPLSNFFGRLDYQLNDVHRLVFHYNYSRGELLRQQNGRGTTTVVYESNFHNFVNVKNAPLLQLFSNFKNGSFNEMFVGYNVWNNRRTPLSKLPQITINTVGGANGNTRILAGADQFSQGNELDTKTWEFTDNFTKPIGAHTITVGTRNERVWLRNLFTQSSYGVWSFRNLDSLSAGNPNTFRKAIILANGGNVYFTGLQSALYAQDQWQVNPNLAVTYGVRADISKFLDDVKYNAAIDSAYGRRTDNIPKSSLQWSPRIGFNWDVTGTLTDQVRGGVGLFVGTPPYVWLENAYVNSGNIITFLNCTTAATPAPAFNLDPTTINGCRNGPVSGPIGDVNFLAKGLKFPQPLRATLAYDRRLPWDLIATLEGMYSKTLNQLFTKSLNVQGAAGLHGPGRPDGLHHHAQHGQRRADTPASCCGYSEWRSGPVQHRDRPDQPEQGLRVQPHSPVAEAVFGQLGGHGGVFVRPCLRRAELHVEHRDLELAVRSYAVGPTGIALYHRQPLRSATQVPGLGHLYDRLGQDVDRPFRLLPGRVGIAARLHLRRQRRRGRPERRRRAGQRSALRPEERARPHGDPVPRERQPHAGAAGRRLREFHLELEMPQQVPRTDSPAQLVSSAVPELRRLVAAAAPALGAWSGSGDHARHLRLRQPRQQELGQVPVVATDGQQQHPARHARRVQHQQLADRRSHRDVHAAKRWRVHDRHVGHAVLAHSVGSEIQLLVGELEKQSPSLPVRGALFFPGGPAADAGSRGRAATAFVCRRAR